MARFALPRLERTGGREIVGIRRRPCAERRKASEKFTGGILPDADVAGSRRRVGCGDDDAALFLEEGEISRDDALLGGAPLIASRLSRDGRTPSGGKRAPRGEILRRWRARNLFAKIGGGRTLWPGDPLRDWR